MAAHSSVLAWRILGTGSLVGCCLRRRTESDTTEVTQQQQQCWVFEAVWPFSNCGEQWLLFIAVCGLLIVRTSLAAELRLQCAQASVVAADGLSSCGSRALEHRLNSCGAWAQLLPWHVESSQIRDQTHVSCIGRQILYLPGKSLYCNF